MMSLIEENNSYLNGLSLIEENNSYLIKLNLIEEYNSYKLNRYNRKLYVLLQSLAIHKLLIEADA